MANPIRSTYVPVQLAAGHFPVVMESVVIAQGMVLAAGAVLGKVTASDEYVLSLAAAEDGSETPDVILAEAVDTTEGAAPAPVMLTGEVLAAQLTLGAGHTIASVKAALRPLSLFIR
ncbi:head decoration protein [Halopseudomonas phragmitis]|uniref:Head decoration protein n=1 Tax=Halopseudomonas phragmitis TaxID=1931241 RepID=A0A1V0B9M9_9GAMM|nr:head decoration protein [Halopseudomonas phragmitis]AQZ96635.1 head decoration protein [Halopseudomonas phragmitis]